MEILLRRGDVGWALLPVKYGFWKRVVRSTRRARVPILHVAERTQRINASGVEFRLVATNRRVQVVAAVDGKLGVDGLAIEVR